MNSFRVYANYPLWVVLTAWKRRELVEELYYGCSEDAGGATEAQWLALAGGGGGGVAAGGGAAADGGRA